VLAKDFSQLVHICAVGDLALLQALNMGGFARPANVPNAGGLCQARIFLGCPAVGFFRRVFVRQPSLVPIPFFFFQVPSCIRRRSVVPVEKLDGWDVERYFVVEENLSGGWKGIVANVCVSAVVPFRSRVLSTGVNEIKKIH
jgi:hypothetical protein